MNFLKNALSHWHTSLAGLAAGLAVVAQSYKAGMTWKQWALAAALTLGGFAAPDAGKVAKTAAIILLCLMLSGPAMAQNSPLFSVSTQAVALRIGGQTVAGTDAIGSFNLTPNLQLQSDNVLAPANNYQGYFGGVKYYAPFLAKPLAKTSLSSVKPYIHAALGVVRNVPATGSAQQHYGALAGAGFDYQVNGTFSFGPRVEYLNSPGFGPSPHGVAVSANLTIILGHK